MPSFSANQTHPQPSQAASLSARATFSAARVLPAPTMTARLEVEPIRTLSVAQWVAPDRVQARLVWSAGRLPAEPRPEGTPALPRSY